MSHQIPQIAVIQLAQTFSFRFFNNLPDNLQYFLIYFKQLNMILVINSTHEVLDLFLQHFQTLLSAWFLFFCTALAPFWMLADVQGLDLFLQHFQTLLSAWFSFFCTALAPFWMLADAQDLDLFLWHLQIIFSTWFLFFCTYRISFYRFWPLWMLGDIHFVLILILFHYS